mmetsp:Transcript_30111/g.58863  ORF Transcript_30111/g.58863 Transcript_30111/m.58863 type:complete len:215 (+) Transcript_30111:926-1570(+)
MPQHHHLPPPALRRLIQRTSQGTYTEIQGIRKAPSLSPHQVTLLRTERWALHDEKDNADYHHFDNDACPQQCVEGKKEGEGVGGSDGDRDDERVPKKVVRYSKVDTAGAICSNVNSTSRYVCFQGVSRYLVRPNKIEWLGGGFSFCFVGHKEFKFDVELSLEELEHVNSEPGEGIVACLGRVFKHKGSDDLKGHTVRLPVEAHPGATNPVGDVT